MTMSPRPIVWTVPVAGFVLMAAAMMVRHENMAGTGTRSAKEACRGSRPIRLPEPAADVLSAKDDRPDVSTASVTPSAVSDAAPASNEDLAILPSYQAFLAAVIEGDDEAQARLHSVLRREPEAALRLARKAVRGARTRGEREFAQRTVRALSEE